MAKVRTLSRTFMKGHPKEGQQTFFVEQFLHSIQVGYKCDDYLQRLCLLNTKNLANGKLSFEDLESFWLSLQPVANSKNHTIRAKNFFNVGDKISIRCWFGKPYHGCQIILADDLELKKVWDVDIAIPMGGIRINGDWKFENFVPVLKKLVKNDGLTVKDFKAWFNTPSFVGQILCWSEMVEY